MKKSPNPVIDKCLKKIDRNFEEKKLFDLSNKILSDALSKCVVCGDPLNVFNDDTIRCKNLACDNFMVITPGSQMTFDF